MKRIILIYSLLFFVTPRLFSNETSASKQISKEWSVNANADVTFNTKYQDVEVIFWKENKVRIEVEVASNSEKVTASDLADKLDVTGETAANGLVVSVNLKPEKNSVWDWIFGSKKIDVSIKSTLYVPASAANFLVRSSYADIKSESIPVNFNLKSNYGDITIGELKKTSVISANYSDMKIGSAENLEIASNYGDISISNAGQLKIASSYSDITIGQLERSFTVSSTYGDIKVQQISKDFSSIKCSSTYSDIEVGINDANPVQLDVHATHSDITNKGLLLVKLQDEDNDGESIFKARTKSASASSASIVINSNFGDILFKKN